MYSTLFFCDDEGHYAVDQPKELRAYIQQHFKGREGVITVETRETWRSQQANAYYWSVVVKAAADESKHAPKDIHAFWCDQFLPDEHKQLEFFHHLTGQRIKAKVDARRSSKLTGREFYDFVEECRLWLQEFLGVTTPDPDKAYWRKRGAKAHDASKEAA